MILDDSAPRYTPHLAAHGLLSMGLQALDPAHWIETDSSLARFHRHKLSMRGQHGDAVFAALPASRPAQRELARMLLAHLLAQHSDAYERRAGCMVCRPGRFELALSESDPEPLWHASLLIADDLAIMQPSDRGYLLTAASLASPSHWRLQDKLGLPMHAIHDPIPGVHSQLTQRIDRFLAHISPQRPVCRFNWGLQAGPALFQPRGLEAPVSPRAPIYYRVERQTLRRLPESGAVAFTIRVFLHPLAALAELPGGIQRLLEAVDSTPPELAEYKGFTVLRDALAQYRVKYSP